MKSKDQLKKDILRYKQSLANVFSILEYRKMSNQTTEMLRETKKIRSLTNLLKKTNETILKQLYFKL